MAQGRHAFPGHRVAGQRGHSLDEARSRPAHGCLPVASSETCAVWKGSSYVGEIPYHDDRRTLQAPHSRATDHDPVALAKGRLMLVPETVTTV
ncbi:hypothetical protein GCM10023238_08360 [Streptomyces heliomycini]